MLNELALSVNQWALKNIGREWIDYLASNTMNIGTKRVAPFFWTYDCQAKLLMSVMKRTTPLRLNCCRINMSHKPKQDSTLKLASRSTVSNIAVVILYRRLTLRRWR